MIDSMNAATARNNFSDLLSQVKYGGKKFIIKKIGKPVAVLINIDEYKRFSEVREYFFKRIKETQVKNSDIPLKDVERDVSEAIIAIRQKKTK